MVGVPLGTLCNHNQEVLYYQLPSVANLSCSYIIIALHLLLSLLLLFF